MDSKPNTPHQEDVECEPTQRVMEPPPDTLDIDSQATTQPYDEPNTLTADANVENDVVEDVDDDDVDDDDVDDDDDDVDVAEDVDDIDVAEDVDDVDVAEDVDDVDVAEDVDDVDVAEDVADVDVAEDVDHVDVAEDIDNQDSDDELNSELDLLNDAPVKPTREAIAPVEAIDTVETIEPVKPTREAIEPVETIEPVEDIDTVEAIARVKAIKPPAVQQSAGNKPHEWVDIDDETTETVITKTYRVKGKSAAAYVVHYNLDTPDQYTVHLQTHQQQTLFPHSTVLLRQGKSNGTFKRQLRVVPTDHSLDDYVEEWTIAPLTNPVSSMVGGKRKRVLTTPPPCLVTEPKKRRGRPPKTKKLLQFVTY